MSFDTFAGVALDQGIGTTTWDSSDVTWNVNTWLKGKGDGNAYDYQNPPNQGFANYQSLPNHIGQAVFFKMAPGRGTTYPAMIIYIDGSGGMDQYNPPDGARVSIGDYNNLAVRDTSNVYSDVTVPYTIADNTEYCLQLAKTTNVNGKEYRGTLYASSNGVRGAQLATQLVTLATAVPGTNKRVHFAAYDHNLITITRVESIDAAAADTTAPILTTPTATVTTSTTATGIVATNEGGGVLYYLADTSATATVSTVKTTGGTQAVSATGARTVALTGLTAGTTYYLHFVQTDAAGNDSLVANTASFTTPTPDTTAPTFAGGSVITPGTITASSLAFSFPVATDNVGVVGYQISKDSGATWFANGTGSNGSFTGLASSTTYQIWVRAYDNGSPVNYSTPLQLSMTTSASATGTFVTDALTSAGTLRASQAVTYEWHAGGVVGATTGTITYGSGTLSTGAVLTATGLTVGAGYILIKSSDGGIAYQTGTVA